MKMKIEFLYANDDLDGRSAVLVKKDGGQAMLFADGEPEDNSLGRNFNDIFMLPSLLEEVAGADEVEVVTKEITWSELWD
jgi:hypothetical protein